MTTRWLIPTLVALAIVPSFASSSDSFIDGFTAGIDTTYWAVNSNQPLYTVDDSNGDVRCAKTIGGSGFQYVRFDLRCNFSGDFDVSVDFSDAMIDRVNGAPGNQVQLLLVFGGQLFAVVRSDELSSGDNVHIFASPPGAWFGAQATTVSHGTLRVVRTGSMVSGYLDGILVYSAIYNSAPVTFMNFALQNNGTNDPTSVTFDNFSLVADTIDCPLATAVDTPPAGPSPTLTAYPNPFNPSTTIAVELPVEVHLELRVYDIGGRLVRVLLDERRDAGYSEVRWDGRDDRGAPAASGVYFVRLRAGADTAQKKIVLLK